MNQTPAELNQFKEESNYKLRADKTLEEEFNTFMLPSNSCISGMAKISARTLTTETPYLFKTEKQGNLQYKLKKPLDKYFKGRTFQVFLTIVALLNKRGVQEYVIENKSHKCLVVSYEDILSLLNRNINTCEKNATIRKQISRAKERFNEELDRIKNIEIERRFIGGRNETARGGIFETTSYTAGKLFVLPFTNWFIEEITQNTKAREFPIELLHPDFESCANLGYAIYYSLSAEFTTAEQEIVKNMEMATALSYCPDLPSVKDVKEKYNYRYKQEIIEPFLNRVQQLNKINGLKIDFITDTGKEINIYNVYNLPIEQILTLKLKTIWSGKRFLSERQFQKVTQKDNI